MYPLTDHVNVLETYYLPFVHELLPYLTSGDSSNLHTPSHVNITPSSSP